MSTKLHAAYIATILAVGGVSYSVAVAMQTKSWQAGWDEAAEHDYFNHVALCQDMKRDVKIIEKCIDFAFWGASDEATAALEASGYKGHLMLEETYKTREAALNDLNKNGWVVEDAEEIGDTLVWDDYPRIMKLVPTKTGWAWVGTFADIDPGDAKKGKQEEG